MFYLRTVLLSVWAFGSFLILLGALFDHDASDELTSLDTFLLMLLWPVLLVAGMIIGALKERGVIK